MPGPRLPLRAVPARCRRDKVSAGVAGLLAPPARGRAPSAAPRGALTPAPPPRPHRVPLSAGGRGPAAPSPGRGLRGVKVMGGQPVCREAQGHEGRGARGDEDGEVGEIPPPCPYSHPRQGRQDPSAPLRIPAAAPALSPRFGAHRGRRSTRGASDRLSGADPGHVLLFSFCFVFSKTLSAEQFQHHTPVII